MADTERRKIGIGETLGYALRFAAGNFVLFLRMVWPAIVVAMTSFVVVFFALGGANLFGTASSGTDQAVPIGDVLSPTLVPSPSVLWLLPAVFLLTILVGFPSYIRMMLLAAEIGPRPKPGLFYWRWDRAEFRALIGILLGGLIFLLTFGVLSVLGNIVVKALSGLIPGPSETVRTILFIVTYVSILSAVIWLAVRIYVYVPHRAATEKGGLREAFRLTRGKFWTIFGLLLIASAFSFFLFLYPSVLQFVVPILAMIGLGAIGEVLLLLVQLVVQLFLILFTAALLGRLYFKLTAPTPEVADPAL